MTLYALIPDSWQEIGQAWPIFIFIGGCVAWAVRSTKKYLKKSLSDITSEHIRPIQVEIRTKLNGLEEQFKNNGGSSMRDVLDRTERTSARVEEKVDLVSAQMKAVRSGTSAPYVEMDKQLNHTFVNSSYAALFGIPWEDAMGNMQWELLVHPDDRERLQQERAAMLHTPHPYITPARIINRTTNELISIITYGFPMTMRGEFIGYAATVAVEHREPLDPALLSRIIQAH